MEWFYPRKQGQQHSLHLESLGLRSGSLMPLENINWEQKWIKPTPKLSKQIFLKVIYFMFNQSAFLELVRLKTPTWCIPSGEWPLMPTMYVQSTRTFRVWFSKIVDCLGRHSSSKQECQDSSSPLYSVLLAVMKGSWFLQKRKTVFMKKLSAHSLVFSTRVTGQSWILEICLSPFNLGEVWGMF